MSRYIKTFIMLFAVSQMLPAMVSANVIPAHKYKQGAFKGDHQQEFTSGKELARSCEALGYYSSPVANATCPSLTVGTKTCYKCTCPSQYEFSCTSTGFAPPEGGTSVGCTIGGNTLYTTCSCSSGYISSTLLDEKFATEFSGSEVKIKGNSGKEIVCYSDTFSCKNGREKLSISDVTNISGSGSATKFTAKNDNAHIIYTGQSLLKSVTASNNLFCVTGAARDSSGVLYASRAAGTDCAKYHTANARYFGTMTYGYYEADCSENDYCAGSGRVDCVTYSGKQFTAQDGSKRTCYAFTGCENGIVTNATTGAKTLCSNVAVSTGFSKIERQITTPSSSTPQTCYQLSCNTSNSWQQAYIGATKATTEYEADPDSVDPSSSVTHYTYDVKSATAGSNILICRRPNGCRASTIDTQKWYNFSPVPTTYSDLSAPNNYYATETCWDGWLALWRKNEVCK